MIRKGTVINGCGQVIMFNQKSLLDLRAPLGGVSSPVKQTASCLYTAAHAPLHSPWHTRLHCPPLPGQRSTLPISGSTGPFPLLTLPLIAVPGASSKFYPLL